MTYVAVVVKAERLAKLSKTFALGPDEDSIAAIVFYALLEADDTLISLGYLYGFSSTGCEPCLTFLRKA